MVRSKVLCISLVSLFFSFGWAHAQILPDDQELYFEGEWSAGQYTFGTGSINVFETLPPVVRVGVETSITFESGETKNEIQWFHPSVCHVQNEGSVIFCGATGVRNLIIELDDGKARFYDGARIFKGSQQ